MEPLNRATTKPTSDTELSSSLAYTAINLYELADQGHLQLIGPTLSPGAPGWRRLSAGTQLSSAFREPERLRDKTVSWIEGKGGKIIFPLSGDDHRLEELLIWLHPVAPHQIVSIFVDEILLKNLSLKSKGQFYRLPLPQPLTQGEHALRLYFRFTRPAPWGGRTPGAVGPLSFVPKGQQGAVPEKWAGKVMHQQQLWGALFAPPPASWRFFFFPPYKAQFKATLYLPPLAPKTRFTVFATTDQRPEKLLFERVLESHPRSGSSSSNIIVDLSDYTGNATQLTLKSEEIDQNPQSAHRPRLAQGSTAEMGWLNPRIVSLYPAPRELPPIKRLIIWIIDGLQLETVLLSPEQLQSLPSLKFIADRSLILTRVWTDDLQSKRGHKQLLHPSHAQLSLIKQIKDAGGSCAYIGSTSVSPPELDTSFTTEDFVDAGELDEHPHQALLMKVQQMSKLGQLLTQSTRQTRLDSVNSTPKELIYIHSPHEQAPRKKYPFELTQLEREWIEKQTQKKQEQQLIRLQVAHLRELDYTLAQLLSEVSLAQVEKETAILIVGSSGKPAKLVSPTPARMRSHLETSALLYHPLLDVDQRVHLIDQAHLSALHDTLLSLLIGDPYERSQGAWMGSLAPFMFQGAELPPMVSQAQRGAHLLTRIRDYYLFERPHGSPSLWQISLEDASDQSDSFRDLSEEAPILLRTLRDGLKLSPLLEGLSVDL